jgi:UDP-N-acetylglucosamine 2-epimerase (non-hydrolysing)/GDP/UDP-N,N'-diacetylbacillosamine 2-epimerase (hydrolysing)
LLSKDALQTLLGLPLHVPTALVTFHPETAEAGRAGSQIDALLEALLAEAPLQAVFTKANADAEGMTINERLAAFCATHAERFRLVDSLGTGPYLSCLRHLDMVVGNSSSGVIEAPSFAVPVVNVGNRQKGRIMAENVIQVGVTADEIRQGIRMAGSPELRARLVGMINPYDPFGDGRAGARIAAALREFAREGAPAGKAFVDLPMGGHRA